jgi:2,3-dihydroxybenzoate-AMP ligase
MCSDHADSIDGPRWTGWPGEDAERYRAAGYWTGNTFSDLLRTWASEHGGRAALVDGARRWTYRQLDEAADLISAGLRRLGLRRGDRVILQLPNRGEFVEIWFGLQRLGAVPVHAMPGHRRAEIAHLAALSGAAGYIVADRHARFDYRDLAAQVQAERDGADEPLRHVVVLGDPGGFTGYADLLDGPAERPGAGDDEPVAADGWHDGRPSAADLALLLLSGGTTGAPKLIPRSHDDYAYNARVGAEICRLGPDDVYLAVLPVGFNFTFACPGVLGTLMAGGTVVVAPNPSPATAFRLIEQDELVCTTQGRPSSLADEIRVVDPGDGRPVPPGEPGELHTRGPYTLRGYYRADTAAASSFTPDGFYRTGDLVRQLPTGHLNVVGRVKDQINRGGEKIAATEVEGHLLAHPAVRQAALVGVPDEQWGEAPAAVLVCTGPTPTAAEVVAFLRGRGLAAYKLPDRVEYVDAMPLTAVGKIDKKVLAQRLATAKVTTGPDA